jgi:hypothetical protein
MQGLSAQFLNHRSALKLVRASLGRRETMGTPSQLAIPNEQYPTTSKTITAPQMLFSWRVCWQPKENSWVWTSVHKLNSSKLETPHDPVNPSNYHCGFANYLKELWWIKTNWAEIRAVPQHQKFHRHKCWSCSETRTSIVRNAKDASAGWNVQLLAQINLDKQNTVIFVVVAPQVVETCWNLQSWKAG